MRQPQRQLEKGRKWIAPPPASRRRTLPIRWRGRGEVVSRTRAIGGSTPLPSPGKVWSPGLARIEKLPEDTALRH